MLVPPPGPSREMARAMRWRIGLLHRHDPVRRRIEGHDGYVIVLIHYLDCGDRRGLAHFQLRSGHRSRAVDDDGQRAAGHDLGIFYLKVDRHGGLDRGVGPTPGAKAFGPAQHDQASAQVLSVADQHFNLFVADRRQLFGRIAGRAGHIGQNHQVEALQFGQVGKQLVAGLHRDRDILFAQKRRQAVELSRFGPVFDQQHLAGAADQGEGGGFVVLGLRVAAAIGNQAGGVRVKIRNCAIPRETKVPACRAAVPLPGRPAHRCRVRRCAKPADVRAAVRFGHRPAWY